MNPVQKRITNLVKEKNTFLVQSLGCRTNAAEISAIGGWLESLGLKADRNNPDIILVNTCAVTKTGLQKSLKRIKKLKSLYPKSKIIAIGCGVENSRRLFNIADLSIDNFDKEEIIDTFLNTHSRDINFFAQSGRFLLRIQSGCNHFCSYCIVPYLRKNIYQLDPKSAIKKIEKAVSDGYREVILTGTNLGFYGKKEKYTLSDLVEKILNETNVKRVSFGSLNYEAFSKKLISLFKKEWGRKDPRLNRYLHIPLQSGSDSVLKNMNRPYSSKDFSKLINSLSKKNPLLKIGTDIIVGFPGETESDFKKTRQFVNRNPIHRLHVFRYSPRKGTYAEKMAKKWGIVDKSTAGKRAQILRQISKEKERSFKNSLIGKTLPTLFLKRKDKQTWQGLTDNYTKVTYKSEKNLRGKIRKIKIS